MGQKRKKRRTHVKPEEDASAVKVPKTFVFKRGRIGRSLGELVQDVREVFLPNTAANLKERRSNTLKDFVHISSQLGITHFLMFSATDKASYLRVARVPRGPTLKFRVSQYALTKDVKRIQRRPIAHGTEFNTAPLVVLNNFPSNERHTSLMTVIFQSLFPAINIHMIKLSDCRRVVLLNYKPDTETVEFRHYAITASPVGVSRTVKRVVQTRIPKLSHLDDVADYINGIGVTLSDSEFEDEPDDCVEVPHNFKRKQAKKERKHQSAIRLQELGPRMALTLVKVEEGLCDGSVLYHKYVTKTAAEVEKDKQRVKQKERLREKRRKEQESNVEKKRKLKEKQKQQAVTSNSQEGVDEAELQDEINKEEYEKEVGEAPDPDLFDSRKKRKRSKHQFSKTKRGGRGKSFHQ